MSCFMMLSQCLLLLFDTQLSYYMSEKADASDTSMHRDHISLCTEISPESVNRYLASDAGHAANCRKL